MNTTKQIPSRTPDKTLTLSGHKALFFVEPIEHHHLKFEYVLFLPNIGNDKEAVVACAMHTRDDEEALDLLTQSMTLKLQREYATPSTSKENSIVSSTL